MPEVRRTPRRQGVAIRIVLDLDGCLFPFDRAARDLLAHHRGVTISTSEHWDWIADNCSSEDWRWLWTEGIEHGLFRHSSPYPGAIRAATELSKLGHLAVVTSRPEAAIAQTLSWLGRYEVPVQELHVVQDRPKSSIRPHADVYIDDAPHVVLDLVLNTSAAIVCFAQKWNRDIPSRGRLQRMNNWTDVIDHVRRLG